jgi:ribosome-interacting GTPase 1
MPRTSVAGNNLNNLRYADDTVMIAENERDLQALIDRVRQESEIKGLRLNKKKTQEIVISKKNSFTVQYSIV